MEYFLDAEKLKVWLSTQFENAGLNPDSTYHLVAASVSTSLRGVDSHGINLIPHYHRAVVSGRINRSPRFDFVQTASGTGTLNADHAAGHHAGAVAMEKAIELAEVSGIGAVGVKDSSHFGAAAYFGLLAARKNMLGFAFTNADALVKAHGAKQAFFGTNPICFTAPLANEEPFCLDMATSGVSWNKILNYRRRGDRLPDGWAFDAHGQPAADPQLAKSLNPSGGYKGYGLGMMVDVLCALLVGGMPGKDLLPMYTSPIETRRRISHFFMALNISKFIPVDAFRANLQEVVDRLRKLEPVDSNVPVMVAGDPEKKMERVRLRAGIPMDAEKFAEFEKISSSVRDCLV